MTTRTYSYRLWVQKDKDIEASLTDRMGLPQNEQLMRLIIKKSVPKE